MDYPVYLALGYLVVVAYTPEAFEEINDLSSYPQFPNSSFTPGSDFLTLQMAAVYTAADVYTAAAVYTAAVDFLVGRVESFKFLKEFLNCL